MGRTRDVSKILTSNTSILSLASASTTYATKTSTGLNLIIPSTIANTNGTASIGTNGTVSFSAASSVSLNDVFSTTYTNYRIVLEATQSADNDLTLRLRVSGADNTSLNYTFGRYYSGLINSIAAGNEGNVTSSGFSFGSMPLSSAKGSTSIDICNPFVTDRTSITFIHSGKYFQIMGGITTVTTSYTGFTFFPSSGTMTGTISVYGYNK